MISPTTSQFDAAQFDVDLFCGALNPAVGRVYARLVGEAPKACVLAGTLSGPSCQYAATLPATSRFNDRGPGGPPLAEAIVPEPTYWTPEMPQLYRAQLELRLGEQTVATFDRVFGFRPLGVTGQQLRLSGKNWVLRGVRRDAPSEREMHECHQSGTALVVFEPNEAVCAAASRIGVLVVAELATPQLGRVRRLSRWPAVGIVSLPAGARPDFGGLGHNLLLAERVETQAAIEPSDWADLMIVELGTHAPQQLGKIGIPVIPARRAPAGSIASDRAGCDRLQAELAAQGLLAGYIA